MNAAICETLGFRENEARRSSLLAIALAVVSVICAPFAIAADVPAPIKVCLVSGSLEYKSKESLDEFQKYLETNYPIRCTRAFIDGTDISHLPGLENLDDADVILLFTKRLKLSGDELERIKKYCLSGKPIVGVRTASHAIQTWLDLDHEVLGGNYKGHYADGPLTQTEIVAAAKNHPVLTGVTPFRSAGSLYKNKGLSDDVEILLTGTTPEATEPIAWTRNYKGARIFYTSLGHPQDFTEPSFRRMLVNALFWTTGRDVPAK